MKFLRRSILGAIAGAAARWGWRNRTKLTNRADRHGISPENKNNGAKSAADRAAADRTSIDVKLPADLSAPVS
jgi:hypothetical protein